MPNEKDTNGPISTTQSQGARKKMKRSRRVLRNKISFDIVAQTRSGTNCVKNLPNYMKCLNNEKRERLGWHSPFKSFETDKK